MITCKNCDNDTVIRMVRNLKAHICLICKYEIRPNGTQVIPTQSEKRAKERTIELLLDQYAELRKEYV